MLYPSLVLETILLTYKRSLYRQEQDMPKSLYGITVACQQCTCCRACL